MRRDPGARAVPGLPLGGVLGVPVAVSPGLAVLVLGASVAAGLLGGALVAAVGMLAVVAASLLAHELAHALAARWCGYRVDGVRLSLLGGGTAWSGRSAPPEVAAVVAAAGPATTAVLACAFVLAGRATGGLDGLLLAGAVVNVLDTLVNLVPLPGSDGRKLLAAARGAGRPASGG